MQLLDGKKLAAEIRAELKVEVDALVFQIGRRPRLAVILSDVDTASQVYVRNKVRACEEVGIILEKQVFEVRGAGAALDRMIGKLNRRSDVDGILLQLPLPKGFNMLESFCRIAPEKDVDGLHPFNVGRLVVGLPGFRSCTPRGIMELLQRYGYYVCGKHAVVLGRSNIVGKPLAALLTAADATVTVCHSHTYDVAAECRRADFVFAAIGVPRFVTADMVAKDAVVVDVGINWTEAGLVGDCDFSGLEGKVAAISPVPGGVGPMSIAILLHNTVKAFKLSNGLPS